MQDSREAESGEASDHMMESLLLAQTDSEARSFIREKGFC